MSRLLVEVHVPTIGSTFDISIPRNARVYEILPLIVTAISRISDGLFIPNDVALCNGYTGSIYSNGMSVSDMLLKNGSRLMLV